MKICINKHIRPLLEKLWNNVEVRGRLWGLKKAGNNPKFGSHITFIDKDEAVTIFLHENQVVLSEFKQSQNTKLGKLIREILNQHNFPSKQ